MTQKICHSFRQILAVLALALSTAIPFAPTVASAAPNEIDCSAILTSMGRNPRAERLSYEVDRRFHYPLYQDKFYKAFARAKANISVEEREGIFQFLFDEDWGYFWRVGEILSRAQYKYELIIDDRNGIHGNDRLKNGLYPASFYDLVGLEGSFDDEDDGAPESNLRWKAFQEVSLFQILTQLADGKERVSIEVRPSYRLVYVSIDVVNTLSARDRAKIKEFLKWKGESAVSENPRTGRYTVPQYRYQLVENALKLARPMLGVLVQSDKVNLEMNPTRHPKTNIPGITQLRRRFGDLGPVSDDVKIETIKDANRLLRHSMYLPAEPMALPPLIEVKKMLSLPRIEEVKTDNLVTNLRGEIKTLELEEAELPSLIRIENDRAYDNEEARRLLHAANLLTLYSATISRRHEAKESELKSFVESLKATLVIAHPDEIHEATMVTLKSLRDLERSFNELKQQISEMPAVSAEAYKKIQSFYLRSSDNMPQTDATALKAALEALDAGVPAQLRRADELNTVLVRKTLSISSILMRWNAAISREDEKRVLQDLSGL